MHESQLPPGADVDLDVLALHAAGRAIVDLLVEREVITRDEFMAAMERRRRQMVRELRERYDTED